jgi:hypothetical protein
LPQELASEEAVRKLGVSVNCLEIQLEQVADILGKAIKYLLAKKTQQERAMVLSMVWILKEEISDSDPACAARCYDCIYEIAKIENGDDVNAGIARLLWVYWQGDGTFGESRAGVVSSILNIARSKPGILAEVYGKLDKSPFANLIPKWNAHE